MTAISLPPLIDSDVAGRLGRVLESMERDQLDALLVTKLINVRWLSGFTGSNGALLITSSGLRLITDGRYEEQAAQQLETAGVQAALDITPTGRNDIVARSLRPTDRLGLEADDVTWTALQALEHAIDAELVATAGLVESLRQIKDPGERSRLERASAIADRALIDTARLLEAPTLLDERPTEQQFASALDASMRRNGADDVSFETIVASGPNSARPHHRPTDRVIESGDLVVVDFGAKVEGYGSDMTRTFVAGGQPSADQLKLYAAVAEAQAAGVAAVVAGADQRSIDTTCRTVLARHEVHGKRLDEAFVHGTGHGLGLEIHEQPILSARSVGILPAGLIVTVEPGAYLPGFGGVRVEDTVVVTDSGCEPITHCPKGLDPAELDENTRQPSLDNRYGTHAWQR